MHSGVKSHVTYRLLRNESSDVFDDVAKRKYSK